MQQAIEKLKKSGHRDASKNQDEALKELEKAKERLEEILRQLREEERDKLLAALESRFQKMLAMQVAVYNDTVSLGKIPIGDRAERHTNKSVQLSRQEAEISIEATKTLTLLREEGTRHY
jgi:DnaJ-domain-containing protein 1